MRMPENFQSTQNETVGIDSSEALRHLGLASEWFSAYPSSERAIFSCRQTFKGIDLSGKRVLEIGAGAGIHSAYASILGAQRVVAIEPAVAGSNDKEVQALPQVLEFLGLSNVEVCGAKLQDFQTSESFDVVLMHNSVNHLDEEMCDVLHCQESAREVYRNIFAKIVQMTASGSRIILSDCSRYNFFPLVGLRSPFARTITWRLHQSPRMWAKLFDGLGVRRESLDWTLPYPLRYLGPLLNNGVAAYFLLSHFRLVMRRQS